MKVGAVILAAGKGTRFGGDKVRARLGGKPVWRWSFDTLQSHPSVDRVVIVCPPGQASKWHEEVPDAYSIVEGGETRQQSCMNGLSVLEGVDIVLVHDAARPFISGDLIDSVIKATHEFRGAAPGIPVTDTLRNAAGEVVDRDSLVAMQTPQGARLADLVEAQKAITEVYTDDIALLRSIGLEPRIVDGDPANIKITTEDDMAKARGIAGFRETRTGLGYDIHQFSSDPARRLFVGGVEFEGAGLEGHSDADALLHAVVDSLLGAASLGDIGQHFPNTDAEWKDRASVDFLTYAAKLVGEHGWKVVNVDATVVAERPKVMTQALAIRTVIAGAIGCPVGSVSIKATTNEKLGAIGRSEGLAAFAVATLTEA